MKKQQEIQLPIPDTVVEPDEQTLLEILHSIEHLSERDCESIVALQKYHETRYLFGMGIPKYNFVSGRIPKREA